MDTRVEKVVRKTGWWGVDELRKDWCEHCNQLKFLSKMDNYVQGMCKECKFGKTKKQTKGMK